jgi:hypothetical protein
MECLPKLRREMVKIDLKGIGWKDVNGIALAQDRNDCCVLLDTVVNCGVP